MKVRIVITLSKIAGYLIIFSGIGLSVITKDSTYWASGIPSAATLLTAKTLGESFGKNNKTKNDD